MNRIPYSVLRFTCSTCRPLTLLFKQVWTLGTWDSDGSLALRLNRSSGRQGAEEEEYEDPPQPAEEVINIFCYDMYLFYVCMCVCVYIHIATPRQERQATGLRGKSTRTRHSQQRRYIYIFYYYIYILCACVVIYPYRYAKTGAAGDRGLRGESMRTRHNQQRRYAYIFYYYIYIYIRCVCLYIHITTPKQEQRGLTRRVLGPTAARRGGILIYIYILYIYYGCVFVVLYPYCYV